MRRYVSTKGVTDNNVILSPLPNDIKGKFWCSQWSKETLTQYLTQSGYGNKSGSGFKKIGNPETEPLYWHKLGKHGLKWENFCAPYVKTICFHGDWSEFTDDFIRELMIYHKYDPDTHISCKPKKTSPSAYIWFDCM